jgi:hypothetical protein
VPRSQLVSAFVHYHSVLPPFSQSTSTTVLSPTHLMTLLPHFDPSGENIHKLLLLHTLIPRCVHVFLAVPGSCSPSTLQTEDGDGGGDR